MKARWRQLSLRAKLIAGAVSVIVALTVVYSLLILNRVRLAHDAEIMKRGRAVAEQLADQAEFPMRAGDLTTLQNLAQQALTREEIVAVRFTSADNGKTVEAQQPNAPTTGPRVYAYTLSITPQAFADEIEILQASGGAPAKKPLGEVKVTISLAESDRVLAEIQAALIVTALALMALAILINVQIARRITGPLLTLAEGARKIGEGQFDARMDAEAGGEIGVVAEQFNLMAGNLKRTLDQMIQQEKMASLGRMASGITHEIGNPLNSILLDLGLLLTEAPEGPDREKLLAIQVQARRLKEIVNHLLDYAHTPPAEMQAVDLNDALDQALRVLSHPIAKANLAVRRELAPDLPRARAIKNMCEQVFVNVIANAIEAAGKNGRLTVSATPSADRSRFLISFEDNGPGIPEKLLEQVFDPFFTTKAKGEGTGLGLSICRQIMRGFGGDIRAEACEGGAKIVIEFQSVV